MHAFFSMAVLMRDTLVTSRSSPTICALTPTLDVSSAYAAQSSWSKGSSTEMMGYLSTSLAHLATSSLAVSQSGGLALKFWSYLPSFSLYHSDAATSSPIWILPL